MTNLIRILIDERKNLGLTQSELAEQLDIPTNTYGNWERGHAEPSAEMLVKLADFFGVTTDYLLGREVSENAAIDRRKELRPSTLKLVDATEKLNDMGIAVVLGYVARLIEDNPEFLLPSARLR